MSDFLTRLATRSLHRTQTISPRLSSLFEPVQTPVTSLQRAVNETDTAVVSDRPVPKLAPQAANPPAVVPARRVGEVGAVSDSEGMAPATQTRRVPAAEAVLDPGLSALQIPSLDPQRASTLSGQGKEELDTSFSRAGHTPAIQDGQTGPVAPSKPAAPNVANPPAHGPVLEERYLLIPSQPSAGLELGNFAVAARAERESAQTLQRPESSLAAAEPSVQVTIGRIEVRAEKEPAHKARTAPASRAKPLEDYLRERSRRGSQ